MSKNVQKKRMEELNKAQIISIDAETNGLWGQPFSIAAVVFDSEGNQAAKFIGRCPIAEEINNWVEKNVLPEMEDIPETHIDYKSMLKDFFLFAKAFYKNNCITLTHMGQIVEARLLKDAHDLGIIGDWGAPYEWFDVCLFFGDSVDNYNKEQNIEVEGNPHNPIYDCVSAYKAFKHFVCQGE